VAYEIKESQGSEAVVPGKASFISEEERVLAMI
jgi:hypothetical protein